MKEQQFHVLGLMSGTSLDGLDLAYCVFNQHKGAWYYEIRHSATHEYSPEWKKRLSDAFHISSPELTRLDSELGNLFGQLAQDFIKEHHLTPTVVSSHGHTVFHQPSMGYTLQIGRGANIAARTGLPVVCDFRTGDIAYGGQGAPLVPFGDKLLFASFPFCLNIGGIANISTSKNGEWIAFDICPANLALNHLAAKKGLSFDEDGEIAARGVVDKRLLSRLNALPYYDQPYPKSLGREWITENFFPVLDESELSVEDVMATVCEHIAGQIGRFLDSQTGQMLVTGGGAWNKFLIRRITEVGPTNVFIPDEQTVNFKEALIFAFLGLMRFRNEINTVSTVTGASRSISAGCIYLP